MSGSLDSFSHLIIKAPIYTKEILKLLKNHGSLTLAEIKASFPLIEMKYIRYALRYLKNKGIIMRKPNLLDMRRAIYRITTQDEYFKITNGLQADYNRILN